MINRIRIGNFGRFSNTKFELSPTTLFVGRNESGKSTIFDIIFDGVCSPKGSTVQGRRLRERYGEKRKASLEFDTEPFAIDAEEFLNIHAIPSGNLSVALPSERSWLDRIKADLFSGGLDPQLLISNLEALASTNRGRIHMRILARLEAAQEALQNDLIELREERRRTLEREKNLEKGQLRLERLIEAKRESEGEIQCWEDELEQQRMIRERKDCLYALERIASVRELDDRLEGLSVVRNDEAEKLEALEQNIDDAGRIMERARQTRESLRSRVDDLLNEQEAQSAGLDALAWSADLASQLRRSVEETPVVLKSRVRYHLRPAVLVPSLMVLLAGLTATFMWWLSKGPTGLFWLPGTAGILASIAGFLVSLKKTSIVDDSPRVELVQRTKEEWARRNPDAGELQSSGYEALISELTKKEADYDSFREMTSRLAKDISLLKGELDRSVSEVAGYQESLDEEKRSRENWLTARGAGDSKDYLRKRALYVELSGKREETAQDIDEKAKRYGCDSSSSLRVECETRVNGLNERITSEALSETDLRRGETGLRELRIKSDELNGEIKNITETRAEERGSILGSLGNIPERILDLELRLSENEKGRHDLKVEREAAALARDIFAEVAEESDLLLDDLSEEIAGYYSSFLGTKRSASLRRLGMNDAAAADSGDSPRPIEDLSTGTRDVFYLAARLALAGRSGENRGLLVLDEPFGAIDWQRAKNILSCLKSMQDERPWQIILFSKEDDMEDLCRKVFSSLCVNRLDAE